MTDFSAESASKLVSELWNDSVVPTLTEYIKIPNKSPAFDPDWEKNGYMEDATQLLLAWAREHAPSEMTLSVERIAGKTPLIFGELQGSAPGTILLYGHLDKQPEMKGWSDGFGPWKPVLKEGRLYGRGGADDGYAIFASLSAILSLREQGIPHPRCVLIIEACEESGSDDLPAHIDRLADRIGKPDVVVCLDSGCGDYDRLWCTTSLRGVVTGTIKAELISEGVHSGDASGIVPESFRVIRQLLDRLEDPATGMVKLDSLSCQIPRDRLEQAVLSAEVLGDTVISQFPFHDGVKPVTQDGAELILNRTWRPQLTITGQEGLPAIKDAGNVMRPETAIKISMRLPPLVDAPQAAKSLEQALSKNPPYAAKVTVDLHEAATGWNAPPVAPWLHAALDNASKQTFGPGVVYMGEGGTIPFMGMLGEKFPEAQFLITGVLGPGSNAHGPNEFLDLATAEKISVAVASVIANMPT